MMRIGYSHAMVIGCTLSLGIGFGASRLSSSQKSISTEELLLLDKTGRITARMSATSGSPSLEYLDRDGTTRMNLSLNRDHGSFVISGKNGIVGIETYPLPIMSVSSSVAGPGVRIGLSNGGLPEISLIDSQNRPRGYLRIDKNETVYLALAMNQELMTNSGSMHEVILLEVQSDGTARCSFVSDKSRRDGDDDLRFGLAPTGECHIAGSEHMLHSLNELLR